MHGGKSAAAAAMLVAALVAGCSGGGDGKGDGPQGGDKPGEMFGGKPPAKLSVPPAYQGDKGWDENLDWVPGNVYTVPVSAVPKAGAVALLELSDSGSVNGFEVTVRSADTGKVRWTSKPWQVPTPLEGAAGDPQFGEKSEIPDVTTVVQDGKEYVVAYAHGMKGQDQLHEGKEIVQLAVYDAEATGTSVAPLRVIDVPVSADPGEVSLSDDGGLLLVGWGDEGPYPDASAAVDLLTGKVTSYEDADGLLPQCEEQTICDGGRAVAATAQGPLVSLDGGGFGIPQGWFSDTVRPAGAERRVGVIESWNGRVYGVGDGLVVAYWDTPPPEGEVYGSDTPMWAVHDVATGEIRASMTCDAESPDLDLASREYPVVTSPDGRFAAAGPVAFDLKEKRGICLASDGDRKTVALGSIRNDGTAYGAVVADAGADGPPVVVQADLAAGAGHEKVLDTGVEGPLHVSLDGHGLFLTRDEDENLRVSLRKES